MGTGTQKQIMATKRAIEETLHERQSTKELESMIYGLDASFLFLDS